MGRPVNILGGIYTNSSLRMGNQDCVNQLLEISNKDGARTPAMLRPVPSNRALNSVGWTNLVMQCSVVIRDTIYMVAGGILWKVMINGNTVTRTALTADVFGRNQLSMSYKTAPDIGYDISIFSGTKGSVFNTATAVLTDLAGFTGSLSCAFLDGFMLGNTPDGEYWFTSDIDNAYSYPVFDTYTQESNADKILGVVPVHREVWAVGEKTIEMFFNNEGTYQRNNGTVMERGCANFASVQVLSGIPFWLGDDGTIYMANGYTPEPISTHAIETQILEYDWTNMRSYVWESEGHKVYCLTFVGYATICYDLATREWHRRETFKTNDSSVFAVHAIGRKNYAIIASTSKVYELDWRNFADDDASGELVCMRRTQTFHDNENYSVCANVELIMNTGEWDVNTKPPIVNLRFSDDDGRTWSNWRSSKIGDVGQYQYRVRFYNLGRMRNRVFEISTQGKAKRELLGMNLDAQ